MQDLFNKKSIYFPSRNDNLYSLRQFLDIVTNNRHSKYQLPIIVKVRSLNHDARSIKNLVSKNTLLLLLDIRQLDSIVAEYHRAHEGHHHSYHRHRLSTNQGKKGSKFSRVKKLSRSLASLAAVSQLEVPPNQEFFDADDGDGGGISADGDDSDAHHQRHVAKALNEKRLAAVPLCRLPLQYGHFFELLDESDHAIEPCHQISSLRLVEHDSNDPEKRIEKWPHAFILRDRCVVYRKKQTTTENLHLPNNGRSSHSTVSNDSCYGSSSDFASKTDLILLDDEQQILPSGCILTIICVCHAIQEESSKKDTSPVPGSPSSPVPTSPSSPSSSSKNWFKSKSKTLFSRKHRNSTGNTDSPKESPPRKSLPSKFEAYLKCRTQQGGDIVYISLSTLGLFSPLNCQTHRLKSATTSNEVNPAGLFHLKDLISNFRLPISVRLLDRNIAFDSPYSTATITRDDIATKLRLQMQYSERVVFACPLSLVQPKLTKAPLPNTVIPLPENADIEIQPCLNMEELLQSESFEKLLHTCSQLIEQYQSEISLIHFPLRCADNINRQRPPLYKKRSQSESYLDDLPPKYQFRQSAEQLNTFRQCVDDSSSVTSSPAQSRDHFTKTSLTNHEQQSTSRPQMRIHRQKRCSFDGDTPEDEAYQDVDKIYDYIRSGFVTNDVQKIQEKEQQYNTNQSSPVVIITDPPASTLEQSPGKMITHRFPSSGLDFKAVDHEEEDAYEYQSCKNDGNVDDNQAHALFLAAKHRPKDNQHNTLLSKPAALMKRIHKH